MLHLIFAFAFHLQAFAGPPLPLDTEFWTKDAGFFQLKVGWLIDETKSEDVLAGIVSFEPSETAHACSSIRFVQVADVKNNQGTDLQWPDLLSDRNLVRTANGHFVDSDNSHCRPGSSCSPFFNDSWPDKNYSSTGETAAQPVQPAAMADFPFGWTEFTSINLETCAICTDDGYTYGCMHWGATWPESGEREITPAYVTSQPSSEFKAALNKFLEFYRGTRTRISVCTE